jgi:hypothetical protein
MEKYVGQNLRENGERTPSFIVFDVLALLFIPTPSSIKRLQVREQELRKN